MMTPQRREIQTAVERWTLDHSVRISPADPGFWALIDLIEKREAQLSEKKWRAEEMAYQKGYEAGQGLKG